MTEYAAHEAAAAEEDALDEEARVRAHRIADSEQVAAGAAAETTSPPPDEQIASVRRSGRHHDVAGAADRDRPKSRGLGPRR